MIVEAILGLLMILFVLFIIGYFLLLGYITVRYGWKEARRLDRKWRRVDEEDKKKREQSPQEVARERSGQHCDAEVARVINLRQSRRRHSSMPVVDDDECDALAARAETLRY